MSINSSTKTIFAAFLALLTTSAASSAGTETFSAKDKNMVSVPAAPFDWSGFYLGVNLGGSWGEYNSDPLNVSIDQLSGVRVPNRGIVIVPGTTRPNPQFNDNSEAAFIGGGQLGYNFQCGHWVFGLEADFNGTTQEQAISATTVIPPTILSAPATLDVNATARTDWTSSFRLRVGYAHDRCLFYATGGLGLADITVDESDSLIFAPSAETLLGIPNAQAIPVSGSSSGNNLHVGYNVGAGFEYALTPTISVALEYMHGDYGSENYVTGPSRLIETITPAPAGLTNPATLRFPQTQSVDYREDRVTLKVNIRFASFFGKH